MESSIKLTPKEKEALILTLAQALRDGNKATTLIINLSDEMAEDNIQPTLHSIRNYLNTINGILEKLESKNG